MSADPMQAAVERLTETVAEYALARVRQALALERDRYDGEVAELRDEVHELTQRLDAVSRATGTSPLSVARLTREPTASDPPYDRSPERCHAISPTYGVQCSRPSGHIALHTAEGVTW